MTLNPHNADSIEAFAKSVIRGTCNLPHLQWHHDEWEDGLEGETIGRVHSQCWRTRNSVNSSPPPVNIRDLCNVPCHIPAIDADVFPRGNV